MGSKVEVREARSWWNVRQTVSINRRGAALDIMSAARKAGASHIAILTAPNK